jgi:protease I
LPGRDKYICDRDYLLDRIAVMLGGRAAEELKNGAMRSGAENTGARWSDQEVVVDGNLVTSRKPRDLPAFCRVIIAKLTECAGETPDGRMQDLLSIVD